VLVAVIGFEYLKPQPPTAESIAASATASAPVVVLELSTRHGEQVEKRLEDGSVIRLNTDTALRVVLAPDTRLVYLDRGQAVFEVVHDASRPFHVIAGSADITDVGTKFDVYIQGDSTRVTVLEGQVGVVTADKRTEGKLLLSAGQQTHITPEAGPGTVTAV